MVHAGQIIFKRTSRFSTLSTLGYMKIKYQYFAVDLTKYPSKPQGILGLLIINILQLKQKWWYCHCFVPSHLIACCIGICVWTKTPCFLGGPEGVAGDWSPFSGDWRPFSWSPSRRGWSASRRGVQASSGSFSLDFRTPLQSVNLLYCTLYTVQCTMNNPCQSSLPFFRDKIFWCLES